MNRTRWRISACVLIGVLAVLAFWPVVTPGVQGGPREADAYESKLATLSQAVVDGGTAQASFSERELNARLARLLDNNSEAREARGLRVGVRDLRVDVGESRATLYVNGCLVGLPFVLEYRFSSRSPQDVESVRLGRLPLIQPLKWIAVGHLHHLLRNVRPEREVLERLKSLEIGDDKVLLAVASDHLVAKYPFP